MSVTRTRGQFTIRDTDPVVNAHRVQDIHILPGVAMLDLVYKTLQAQRMDLARLKLRSILFLEPIVTNTKIDRKVTVTVDLKGDEGRITVTSVPWKADRALPGEVTTHMTCLLAPAEPMASTPALTSAKPLPADAVDLDACYGVTRHIGIFHDGFMKCTGRVAMLPSGQHLGEVALGPDASSRAADFLLHPVFLDCSTIVPLFPLHDRLDQASLFIPFAIEEFQAVPLAGHRDVRVLVEPLDGDAGSQELLRYSFGIFDRHGRQLAAIRSFTVKKVRSLHNIRALLEKRTASHVAEPVVTVPVATAPVVKAAAAGAAEAPGDPVLDLIVELARPHLAGEWKSEHAQTSFFELGLDSIVLLDLADALEQRLGVRLYPTVLFERPNPAALAAYLREEFAEACNRYAGGPRAAGPAVVTTAPAPVPAATAQRPEVLVPRWFPVHTELVSSPAQAIALLENDAEPALCEQLAATLETRIGFRGDAAAFAAAVSAGFVFDELCLAAVDHHAAFAALKALIQAGRLRTPLTVRAITLDCFRVHEEAPREDAAHGVWGLLQSLSREYPQVSVSQVDLSGGDVGNGTREWIAPALAAVPTRTLRAIRSGRVYERTLCPARADDPETPAFRRGAAYLVVGGASGVGLELVRHLRRSYAAKVAVVGRRPESAEIVRTLAAEGEYGRDLLYLSASVDDEPALTRAIETARARLGELRGIVHSAMVLEDARLADMDDAAFARVQRPKVAGAAALARATADLALDFLLFFSSAQSFVGNVGQANYAAASTYIDGFAGALRATRRHPVVVVNWGFWSEVGAVASERYRQLMARQGMFGLTSVDALARLEAVLAAGWEQAAIVAAEEPVLEEMGLRRTVSLERAATPVPSLPEPPPMTVTAGDAKVFADTETAMACLLDVARRRVGPVVRDLLASGAVAPQHARLARALEKMTSGAAGDTPAPSEADFAAAVAQLREQFPVLRSLLPLFEACVSAYPGLLAGKTSPATVMFPGGGVDLVRPVYGESAVSRFYNERVAQALVFLARQSPRPLRIVEVGAGTGSTTTAVLDALARAGVDCEYLYTDLWDKLVDDARARLGSRYPQLRFAFFDAGMDPAGQGLRDEFDVVIATNVVHATRDLHDTLRHAKTLLRPGGALVLNESVEVQEYSTYTFGLLPGWWNASDAHERLTDSPLASASRWPALLRDEGFVQVRALVPADAAAAAVRAQQVYLAVSDGELRAGRARSPKPPVTVPAAHGLPAALADALRPFALPAAPRPKHVATFKDHRDNIWVFLNNQPANMFTDEFLGELCATLQTVATLPPAQGRIVYLSHFGEYFSLGGDRSELVRTLDDADAVASFAEKARALIRVITSLDALVVAVVNGTAQGGGFETLFATDLQVVRAGVKLGLPEIKSGLIPGMGGLTWLQHLIGPARTKRLVMLGELIDAEEAHAWGVISHVAADPFAAALAIGDGVKNFEAALYMKRLLRQEDAERLSADIDDWVAYITRHSEWIDTRRISNSRLMVTARAAMLAS